MDLLSVQALLQQGMFKIPSYQRGYSWTSKEVGEFIDDLCEAKELKEHYTGTVTVVEKGEEDIFPKKFKKYDVVDGQQRLTSFTIFIYCIHNRLKKLGIDEDSLNDILKSIIYKQNTILQLHDEVHDFYAEFIISKPIIELPKKYKNKSEQNLANAKIQISKFLDTCKTKSEVEEFYLTLVNKFKINFYILSKESDVGVVFETMNNRGLPLTKMDMVKNYLVYLASRLNDENLAEEINENFGVIYTQLMEIAATPTQEDDVLRFAYIIYKGLSGDDIYKDIKVFLKKDASSEEILDYVIFLKETSKIYTQICTQKFKNENVKILIDKILWLGTLSNFFPLLIILFKNYKENELVFLLRLIEIYSFRVYKVANKQNRAGRNDLHRAAHDIYIGRHNLEELTSNLELSVKQYSENQDFKSSLQAKNFYTSHEPNEISYFFYEYECYLHERDMSAFELLPFKDFKQDVKDKKISIEHISPQKDSSIPSEIHKLGNLTITYDNSLLSDKNFIDKKNIGSVTECML